MAEAARDARDQFIRHAVRAGKYRDTLDQFGNRIRTLTTTYSVNINKAGVEINGDEGKAQKKKFNQGAA